jgi:hypothetical protein
VGPSTKAVPGRIKTLVTHDLCQAYQNRAVPQRPARRIQERNSSRHYSNGCTMKDKGYIEAEEFLDRQSLPLQFSINLSITFTIHLIYSLNCPTVISLPTDTHPKSTRHSELSYCSPLLPTLVEHTIPKALVQVDPRIRILTLSSEVLYNHC